MLNQNALRQHELKSTISRLNNTILFQTAHLKKIAASPALCEVIYKKGEPAIWLKSTYIASAISAQINDLEAQRAAALLELDKLVFSKD